MKNPLALALIVVALLIGTGCQNDYYARQIVQPNTTPGRIIQAVTGDGQRRIQQGKIDLHRKIIGQDGVALDVWVIRAKGNPAQTKGTALLLHGISESKASIPYPGMGKRLAQAGFDVVLVDLRAHGQSKGKYITFGAKEKYDIKAVMDSLSSDGQITEPFYPFGTNLGGAVAIQYAAIDPRCKAVMAVSPFKDATSIAWRICKFNAPTMSMDHFHEVLDLAAKMADFDPDEASTLKAASKLDIPLVLIHGILERTVPMESTRAVYDAAAGPKLLETPDLEQVFMLAVLEDWLANKLISLANDGLPNPSN